MSLTDLYIRDKKTGKIRRIGDDRHDQLTINDEGQLCYYNLQNGDGCRTGDDGGGYEFVPNQDENGFNADPTNCSEIPNGSDLISRQAAIDAVERVTWYHQNAKGEMARGANSAEHQAWYKADDVYKVLNELPSAEPERKTGRWIEYYGDSKCSECGYVLKIYDTNYCPNCGSYNGGGA